jgi:hypothetical protein
MLRFKNNFSIKFLNMSCIVNSHKYSNGLYWNILSVESHFFKFSLNILKTIIYDS